MCIFKIKRFEILALIVLILVTVFLRFAQLGYSDYYDDETKTIYWDKTQSAKEFFLNQRKGPVQFIAVWGVEKTFGISEITIRMPFAVAGILSVFTLYILIRRWYGYKTAFITSLLFSLSGFYIAYSRTAQYQSTLLLCGLLSILLLDVFLKHKKLIYLILSAIFLALAFLSHYDAIFFAVFSFLLLNKDRKSLLIYFVCLTLLTAPFFIPYILGGYFEQNTLSYLSYRFIKEKRDSSLFTYWVYNPTYLSFIPFIASPIILLFNKDKYLTYLFIWALIPLVLFEIVISNPGTHIHNYVLPLLVITGIGLTKIMKIISKVSYKYFYIFLVSLFFISLFIVQTKTYVPMFNEGYPWNNQKIANSPYKVFFYGFPYNRRWDEIETYLRDNGAYTYNTTGNIDIARYYLRGIPRDKGNPHYFIHIYNNQEFKDLEDAWVYEEITDSGDGVQYLRYRQFMNKKDVPRLYKLRKEFYVDDKPASLIYKRVDD